MKRSEVVKIMAEALGQIPAPAYPVAEQVLSRIEGLLGIDYDPEVEPFPENLIVDAFGDILAPRQGTRALNLTVREKREAVRRWNAFSRIGATLQRWTSEASSIESDARFAADLTAILDGREGE